MKRLYLSLAAAIALAIPGCTTTGNPDTDAANLKRITSAVKVAAFNGTAIYLKDHPDARPKFEQASAALGAIAAGGDVDFATIMAIVQQLPVKELQSDEAKLIITSATILLSDWAGSLPLDKLEQLKPVAAALKQGIDMGLALSK